MYPQIKLGPLTIYSYGLMLAIGLAVAIILLCLELRRKGIDPAHGLWIALVVIPSGVVGAKLLYVVEEWDRFVANPTQEAFSGAGLSFYGGLVLGSLAMYGYLRLTRIPFLFFADAAAPGALLARGIARIGCHLAGDGDYGLPTTLPWGTDYSKGIYPPSKTLAQHLPDVARAFPGGVAPDDLPMHPTGVYEFLMSALLFVVLWRYRARIRPDGRMFMLYLVATGGLRFGLEFLAISRPLVLGLTQAQLISLALIAVGALGWARLGARIRPRGVSSHHRKTPVTRTRVLVLVLGTPALLIAAAPTFGSDDRLPKPEGEVAALQEVRKVIEKEFEPTDAGKVRYALRDFPTQALAPAPKSRTRRPIARAGKERTRICAIASRRS